MKSKNKNESTTLLSFEYMNSEGRIEPLTFRNPTKIITAYTVDDVLPSLQIIQEEIKRGYYAAGYLSYESAAAFDRALPIKENSKMPLLWFGIFSEPKQQALSSTGSYELSNWQPSICPDEYNAAISKIKGYIEQGDTYQVNYTIRLYSQFQGDSLAFYEKLKRAQASNYCAYLHTGEHSILSASPELFFQVKNNSITTRPMKGTAKRGNTVLEDEQISTWLYHSEKNRAENLMIVDLLRNDLGMIANTGSVHVQQLFEIERYPTVHQMTSTITATISEEKSIFDIFKALFPCGSITGAPKVRTMEIINELEAEPRDVYCGAIGYITPNQEAIFNVPIRTVVINNHTGQAVYGVGGGITWDSTAEGEYNEILEKARLLEEYRPNFQLLESLLLENGEYFLLTEHLNRLQNGARYFQYPFQLEDIQTAFYQLAKQHNKGNYKVRFLLEKSGEMRAEATPIKQLKAPVKVKLADKPLSKNSPFLYHKTTNREIYQQFRSTNSEIFDVLLWNEAGEVTEFINGNMVLEIDGMLWTPPVECGLLAGTFREKLVRDGVIQEKVVTLADLERSSKMWFINSVRKWLEAEMEKDQS